MFDLDNGQYGITKLEWSDTRSNVGGVLLGSASPFIEIPFTDFINF